MPAFYSRTSGLPIDARVDSPAEIAKLFKAQQDLNISSALLVSVPVPQEFEVPSEQLRSVLSEALEKAERSGVVGRDLTPFLLSHMARRSEGSTLSANIALLENNARVAASIALAL
jgi:pseudouridine-5'-phosphate glycosidase